MNLHRFSSSEGFFACSEPLPEDGIANFDSLRGRGLAVKRFFKRLCVVPFAFLFKTYKTCLSFLGVSLGALLLALTLFASQAAREYFIRRTSNFAQEMADWVLWPVAVLFCLTRLFLASVLHPALYFRL